MHKCKCKLSILIIYHLPGQLGTFIEELDGLLSSFSVEVHLEKPHIWIRIRMSFIGQVCLHRRGIVYTYETWRMSYSLLFSAGVGDRGVAGGVVWRGVQGGCGVFLQIYSKSH